MTTETTRAQDKLIQLADYTPPAFLIETVHLDIDIRSDGTVVKSRLVCRRNPADSGVADLLLDGEDRKSDV